ncbi:MAG: nucleotidyltransferase family protein [Myxococcota bacterium]
MKAAALILTAGRSRRMGQPKAWLRLNGETLLERLVRETRRGGCATVVVVAGADTDRSLASRVEIGERLTGSAEALADGIAIVIGCPDKQPIDSIRAGLAHIPANHAVLLWPIDHPFADAELVARLVRALGEESNRIAVPTAGGKRGHPILMSPDVAHELLTPAADDGARDVVRRDPGRVVTVDAADPRVLWSLNTPDEARALGIEPGD